MIHEERSPGHIGFLDVGIVAPPARLLEIHRNVDARDLPQDAGTNQSGCGYVSALAASLGADLHHLAAFLNGQIGGFGVREHRAHGLLAIDILAGLDGVLEDAAVAEIGGRDDDGVHVAPGQHFPIVGSLARGRSPGFRHHLDGPLAIGTVDVADARNADAVGQLLEIPNVRLAAPARSDDGDRDAVIGGLRPNQGGGHRSAHKSAAGNSRWTHEDNGSAFRGKPQGGQQRDFHHLRNPIAQLLRSALSWLSWFPRKARWSHPSARPRERVSQT